MKISQGGLTVLRIPAESRRFSSYYYMLFDISLIFIQLFRLIHRLAGEVDANLLKR